MQKEEGKNKGVFIGSIPNTSEEDIILTKLLLKKKEKETPVSQDKFYLNTGRASFYLILKSAGVGEEDEVITQSFSCMAASQPILWAGAKPVFADINEKDYNINIQDVRKKITDRTKAIVVQHIFGIPQDLRSFVDEINDKREEDKKILLIEDCAHSLGARYKDGSLVGSKGDFAYSSYSQDKVISSVTGGEVVVNNSKYLEKLKEEYSKLETLPEKESRYFLRYQILWNLIKKTYFFPTKRNSFTLGRLLITIFRKLGWIKPVVDVKQPLRKEIYKNSSSLIKLLELQQGKLEMLNEHRIKIAKIYNEKLEKPFRFDHQGIFLRYPIQISNGQEIKNILKKEGIIIGNWYNSPIYPEGVDLELFNYRQDCPIAERKCKSILNLPTNIEVTEDVAKYIAGVINKYGKPV